MATQSDWNTNRVEGICDQMIATTVIQMFNDRLITEQQRDYVLNTYVCVIKDTGMIPNISERIRRIFSLRTDVEKGTTNFVFEVGKVNDLGSPGDSIAGTLMQTNPVPSQPSLPPARRRRLVATDSKLDI